MKDGPLQLGATRGLQAVWSAPRTAAPFQLKALWSSDRLVHFPELPYPSEMAFAAQGLAVYDFADKRIHVLDAATGRSRFAVGRRGRGPGEFGDRNVRFFGLRGQLRMIEYGDGRVSEVVGQELVPIRIATGKLFSTACAWGEGRVLLQSMGNDKFDDFVSTVGEQARVIDSLAPPWSRHLELPFIVRQAQLRQLDDSTCAYLPTYQQEFAILSPFREPRLGTQIEALPEARSVETRTSRMRRSTLAKGARAGAMDARRWRNFVLVLFAGSSPQRRRIIDVYDWITLRYRGSVLLPTSATRIAVHGDTLVTLGEYEDVPRLMAFLIRAAP